MTTDLPLLLVTKNLLVLFLERVSATGTSRPSALVKIGSLWSPFRLNRTMLLDQRPTTNRLSFRTTRPRQNFNKALPGMMEYVPYVEMQWMASVFQPVKYKFSLSSPQIYLAVQSRMGVVFRISPFTSSVVKCVPHATTSFFPTKVIPKHSYPTWTVFVTLNVSKSKNRIMSSLGNVITSWLFSRRTTSRGFPRSDISLRRLPSPSYKRIQGLLLSASMTLSSWRQRAPVIQGDLSFEPRFTPNIFLISISIMHNEKIQAALCWHCTVWCMISKYPALVSRAGRYDIVMIVLSHVDNRKKLFHYIYFSIPRQVVCYSLFLFITWHD